MNLAEATEIFISSPFGTFPVSEVWLGFNKIWPTAPPPPPPSGGGDWVQVGSTINGSNAELLSWSLALNSDGQVVAVGGRNNSDQVSFGGAVKVFRLIDNVWTQRGATIYGSTAGNFFGWSIDLDSTGNRLAVTENPLTDLKCRVYQFDGTWTQLGQTITTDGNFVKLSSNGDRLVLSGQSNQVRVFALNGNTWEPMGPAITLPVIQDTYEAAAAIHSSPLRDRVIVGYQITGGGGAARVYQFDGTSWVQFGPTFSEPNSLRYGASVAIDSTNANRIAIGDPLATVSGLLNAGRVFVYSYDEITQTWQKTGQTINGADGEEAFGFRVSFNSGGSRIGVYSNNGRTVKVYGLSGSNWQKISQNIFSDAEAGYGVALSGSGNRVAVSDVDFNNRSGRARIFQG